MYNILICDDQPDIVNALKIYLAPEGYKLYEAYTGQQALEMVQSGDFHLVLLDIMMPQMDGITATAKIREFSNIPIILLTAKSETEDKVLAATATDSSGWIRTTGCAIMSRSFIVIPPAAIMDRFLQLYTITL